MSSPLGRSHLRNSLRHMREFSNSHLRDWPTLGKEVESLKRSAVTTQGNAFDNNITPMDQQLRSSRGRSDADEATAPLHPVLPVGLLPQGNAVQITTVQDGTKPEGLQEEVEAEPSASIKTAPLPPALPVGLQLFPSSARHLAPELHIKGPASPPGTYPTRAVVMMIVLKFELGLHQACS